MDFLSSLKVPVFRAEGRLPIPEPYTLTVGSAGGSPVVFSLAEITGWPRVSQSARLVSVSGWSVRATWEGVYWSQVAKRAGEPLGEYLYGESYTGYGSNLRREDVTGERAMLVLGVEGEPLPEAYGGPVRLLIPQLWGYKSIKWLSRVTYSDRDRLGFWEERGYDPQGEITPGSTADLNSKTRRRHGAGAVVEF